MNPMKSNAGRIVSLMAATLAAGAAALLASQPERGHRGPRGRDRSPMAMLRELELTEAQRSSVRALFENARSTGAQQRLMEAKRTLEQAIESGETDEGALRELAYQVGQAEGDAAVERVQMRSELRRLLTSEQRQKLDELEAERRREREERRERLEERRQNRRGPSLSPGSGELLSRPQPSI